MDLEVQVLEARNLQPRPSWQQKVAKSLLRGSEATELMGSTEAQRRRELPWACVRVECGGGMLEVGGWTNHLHLPLDCNADRRCRPVGLVTCQAGHGPIHLAHNCGLVFWLAGDRCNPES